MATNRTKPTPGKVISGTHGYFWWNNSICYEVTSFEAKITTNRETINFSGDMWEDSKLMGVKGEYTVKIKKVYSRAKDYAESLASGVDERLTFIGKLEDPDNGGTERIRLDSCWLDEVTLMNFENGSIAEDEFSGGFTGFEYLDSISDPC
ncbi:MAG: phage tail tube protein [Oscillospiraceae bacterium]|nr:phage tail tube protein [Oscillospiraceae bacterium]